MHLFEILYLRDDKDDKTKANKVSEYYVADHIKDVFKIALECSERMGDEILHVKDHVPVLQVISKDYNLNKGETNV